LPQITSFINELKLYSSPAVYNPWKDFDGNFDIGAQAPIIRCEQLENYLRRRVEVARYIFVAEALGYQGGHFSGIAMTSERILLGHHPQIDASLVIGSLGRRTSTPEQGKDKACQTMGYNEPTATIVWGSILEHCTSPFEVVLWNIFPFHPFKPQGILTNRTPAETELQEGARYLQRLEAILPNAKLISIGRKSANTLDGFGMKHSTVPHPANGGATDFRQAIAELLGVVCD
jgi:hypothetical protein